jgi:hypothetical protein
MCLTQRQSCPRDQTKAEGDLNGIQDADDHSGVQEMDIRHQGNAKVATVKYLVALVVCSLLKVAAPKPSLLPRFITLDRAGHHHRYPREPVVLCAAVLDVQTV